MKLPVRLNISRSYDARAKIFRKREFNNGIDESCHRFLISLNVSPLVVTVLSKL